MIEYLAWWFTGGLAGLVAGAWVLRRRDAMNGAVWIAFAAATVGCLYGAKAQYRLRFEPVWDALMVPPSDLLAAGFNIPLGLVFGFAAAMLVARLLRADALRLADALALAGSVMMPIGRIGCMVTGCCTGTVCPAWWIFGVTRGPATAAYAEQLSAGVIRDDAVASLPVHPLPLYFAALGLVTAAVQLRLLRRGARPGAAAVTGFLLYPFGQLVIEQFRMPSDDRGPVMTVVLVAMMCCAIVAVPGIRLHDRRHRSLTNANHGSFPMNDPTTTLIGPSHPVGPREMHVIDRSRLAPSGHGLASDRHLMASEAR